MSGILVATKSVGFEQRVRRSFNGALNGDLRLWSNIDLAVADSQATVWEVARDNPDVFVLGPDVSTEAALRVAELFDANHPEISVVIVAEPSAAVWESALRAGVRDVLSPAVTEPELRLALQRALDAATRRKAAMAVSTVSGTKTAKVISVIAPKGGVGKTMLASNLSTALAAIAPGRVVLVDLDLQFGDVTSALGLSPDHTIADVAAAPGQLDLTTLKVFLSSNDRSLYALAAPPSPELGENLSDGLIKRILELLTAEFDYVVIDTPAGVGEHTLGALEASTDVILMCDLSVASVRGLSRLVRALDRIGLSGVERRFVLNRADSKVGIDLADVMANVGLEPDVQLPSTRSVPLSMNTGVPIVATAARSPLARAVMGLAHDIAEVEPKPRTRLFGSGRSSNEAQ